MKTVLIYWIKMLYHILQHVPIMYIVNIKNFSYYRYGLGKLFPQLQSRGGWTFNDSYHERWTAVTSKTARKRQNKIGIPKVA